MNNVNMINILLAIIMTTCARQAPNTDSKDTTSIATNEHLHVENDTVETPQGDGVLSHWAKSVHGNGVVIIKVSVINTGVFQILNENGSVFMTMDFDKDKLEVGGRSATLSSQNETMLSEQFGLCARQFYPEYGIAHFDCLAVDDEYYIVTFGDGPGKTKKIAKDKNKFEFRTWSDYILKSKIAFEPGQDKILTSPSGRDELKINTRISLLPLKVDGDWVQVKCDIDCSECPAQDIIGWMRWRENDRLLINLGVIC